MISQIQVESWMLIHACKYRYHGVIQGILRRHHDNIEHLDVPNIYLSIPMIYNIIMTDDVLRYPVVVNHLDFIDVEVPHAVPFKLYSKLSIGLKMKWAMMLLKENHNDTLMLLNKYFPRKGSQYEHATPKELSSLHSVQKNFRKFFLPLLAHQNQREAYFQNEFEEEYGKHFQEALQQLAVLFVEKLTSHLPQTTIEKLLTEGTEQYQPLMEDSTDLSMEMLLDTLHGKEALEEGDLLDLLTMISPLNTQDRVQVDKVWLLSSEEREKSSSKSLLSSHSVDQLTELECSNSHEQNMGGPKTWHNSNQNQTPDRTNEDSGDTTSVSYNKTQLHESFGDFNDKRHLFHCDQKDSQSSQIMEKDIEKNRDSDNAESLKSSGDSVSILRNKQQRTKTRKDPKDDRLGKGNNLAGHPPGDFPDQVHNVTSSSPYNTSSDRQVMFGIDIENVKQENNAMDKGSSLPFGSELVCGDEDKRTLDQQLCSDGTKSQEVEDLGESCLNHSTAVKSDPDVDILEPWLSFSDSPTSLTRCSSVSDIDQISDEDNVVIPPSRMEDVEFWDIFSSDKNNSTTAEPLAVPAIAAHAKHPDMKLCVVKLFRNQILDRQHGSSDVRYDIFS